MSDEIDNLGAKLAEDHKADKRRRAKAATADTVAAGAIEGAGAALDAGGDARDVAAAAIGGAAAGTAEALNDDDGRAELREAVADLGAAVDAKGDDEKPSLVAERIERIQAEAPIDTAYLSGDLFRLMLDLFQTRGKPWSQMLEDEQRKVAIALKSACADALSRTVHAVRSGGAGSFTAKLEGYTNKGAFKINLTAEATRDTSNALFDAEGQFVTVQRADPAQFSGTRPGTVEEFEPDPDQGGLGFEADSDRKAPDPFEDSNQIEDADRDPEDRDRDLADDLDADRDPE